MSYLFVVEDEHHLAEGLRFNLEADGHTVAIEDNGTRALQRLLASGDTVDAIILDVMLPGLSGFDVVRALREAGNYTPVLMLTARGRSEDVLQGFDAGADDYLPKPFALEELLARLRALLRRTLPDDDAPAAVLTLDTLRIDSAARRVWRSDNEIEMSKTEFDLLELLVTNSGIVLEHSTIYDRIWGYDFGPDSKNLAVYIGYIRRKVDVAGEKPLIHTVRGIGYTARVS